METSVILSIYAKNNTLLIMIPQETHVNQLEGVLALFRIDFFGAAHGGGGRGWAKRPTPPSLKSITYILQWWNLAQLYLT